MTISGLGDTDYTTRYRLRDRASQQAAVMTLPVSVASTATSGGVEPPSISASLSSALFGLGTGESSRTNIYEKVEDAGPGDLDLLAELEKWSQMNVAEKIRAQYLESKNMTEESLAQLPPEERQLIEDEIAAAIKRTLTGGDTKAGPKDSAPDLAANTVNVAAVNAGSGKDNAAV